ncbi:hypothetical protein C8Q72DRAFT_775758 [Fomitopsis betulina]|nr:hypothetical protein C8Q72DRAFT_775758 [Fomitopsis betulina]
MSESSINYAEAFGIQSLAAAVIFTILYVPLIGLYLFQAIRRRTQVYILLTLFCLMRVTAFALRSALAGSDTAAIDKSTLIAFQVMYNAGFFSALLRLYSQSLMDMDGFTAHFPDPVRFILQPTFRLIFVHVTLIAAVAISIVGAVKSANGATQSGLNQSSALRSASMYIFLAVTCLVVTQALVLSFLTMRKQTGKGGIARASDAHKIFVILAIATLLLVREAFYGATAEDLGKQATEHLWYPLSALTEFIAVALFAIPGLAPAKNELPQKGEQMEPLV